MKALHVIPAIAPRYGGPSSAVRALCSALSETADIDVELATTDADGPGRRISHEVIPRNFPVHVLPLTFSERWKYSRSLPTWLRQNVSRFDVVHVHALWTHSSAAAARAASRAGVPYIIRPAGMLSKYSLSHRALGKRLYWSLVERTTVRGASCFHATTRLEADDIRHVLPDADVAVISNGVENEAWEISSDAIWLRRRLGMIDDPRPVLLFLSRLSPVKGIVDLLLPGFARMRSSAVLAIAGGPDEHERSYERDVNECVKQLRLEERVHLLGAVSPQDRWQMFDGADAFVLPSHSENFGIVVAEAMARRCPVVITDAVQCCDHVTAAGAGLVVPRDVEALARALEQIVSDRDSHDAMAEAGQNYARRHFCWSNIALEVRQMYEDVVARPRTLRSEAIAT